VTFDEATERQRDRLIISLRREAEAQQKLAVGASFEHRSRVVSDLMGAADMLAESTVLEELARNLHEANVAYESAWQARFNAGIQDDHLCRGDVPPDCAACRLIDVERLAQDRVAIVENAILMRFRAQRPRP